MLGHRVHVCLNVLSSINNIPKKYPFKELNKKHKDIIKDENVRTKQGPQRVISFHPKHNNSIKVIFKSLTDKQENNGNDVHLYMNGSMRKE